MSQFNCISHIVKPIKVQGKSIVVEPMKKVNKSQQTSAYQSPNKDNDIQQIVQKYLGSEILSDSRLKEFRSTSDSITTMFHYISEEEKSIIVSPYKSLSRGDCNRFCDTFQRAQESQIISSPYRSDDEFHHIKTSPNYSPEQLKESQDSPNSLNTVQQNLQQIFESPQCSKTESIPSEQTPQFFHSNSESQQQQQIYQQMTFNRNLPVIEEHEEIRTDLDEMTEKLNNLLGQIDSRIKNKSSQQQDNQQMKVIQKIKQKYDPGQKQNDDNEDQFQDFPNDIEQDQQIFQNNKDNQKSLSNNIKNYLKSQDDSIQKKEESYMITKTYDIQKKEYNQHKTRILIKLIIIALSMVIFIQMFTLFQGYLQQQ